MNLEHLTAPQRKKGPQVLCARTQGSLNGLPMIKRWITGVSRKNGVYKIPNEKAGGEKVLVRGDHNTATIHVITTQARTVSGG